MRAIFGFTQIVPCIILIAMAVSIAFFLGADNRNQLLIGVMCFSPLILLKYPSLYPQDTIIILFCGAIILFPILFHPETMRWSTVLYSVMFCLTFMGYNRLLINGGLTREHYQTLLVYFIYAYAAVLLIQQFCVLTNTPIFNISNYDPQTPWKLNSLTSEPSHSARVVALLMYSYINIKEAITKRRYVFKEDFKIDKWVWIAFLWTMVSMGSGSAFLFLLIVLLNFVHFKTLIPVFALVGGLLIIVETIDGTRAMDRTYKTATAVLTLDEKAIIKADHSASARIVPAMICIKRINLFETNAWFGHGIDNVSTFMSKQFPGVKKGYTAGGMAAFIFEYGIIAFLLFLIFSWKACIKRLNPIDMLFYFFMIFVFGVNNQFVWLAILLLYTNKYFLNKQYQ